MSEPGAADSPSYVARARELLREPWAITSIVWVVAFAIVRPFGDYPLNDDWHYARIAKNFALKGHFALDSPVASSLVGQSLAVWPVIRLLGFTHTAIRMETAVFGLIAIVLLDRLMARARVAKTVRTLTLVALALNPIFFYTSLSFMTELYGYVPGLLAAVLWFRDREAHDDRDLDGAALSWSVSLVAALLFGFAFWVRQFCAAIYPALPGATVFGLLATRRYRSLAKTLPRLLVGAIVYAAILESFFPWAKATGNFTPQFQSALGSATKLEGETTFKHWMLWLVYMAISSAPLLVLLPWRARRWRALLVTSSVLICATYYAKYLLRNVRMDWLHPHMPFLGNIIEDTGLGPITLSDVYWAKLRRPKWEPETWQIIEFFSVHAVAFFAPTIVGMTAIYRRLRGKVAFEVLVYGLLVMLGSVTLSIQAYKMETLDRYHMPSFLVMPVVVAICIQTLRRGGARLGPGAVFGALACLAPVAWFSIAGLHDYYRWNDARWELVRIAEQSGATTSIIEGGYELDGWLHYDEIKEGHPINGCIGGRCRCDYATWYTKDCSFHIGMNTYPNYDVIARIKPSYWLAPGPPMLLSRRRN